MLISIRYVLLEKSIKVFSKPSGLKYDYIVKDIFVFPTEDIQKK